jgi:phosphopantetheinyl transferase (holo-ACP synthase)
MRTEKVTEYLQYHFTDEELLEIARETSRTLSEKRILEDKKAELAKTLAGEIAVKQATIDRLGSQISSGYEWRNIECILRYDSPRPGLVELVRTDTGEVSKTRRMSDGELQMRLEEVAE